MKVQKVLLDGNKKKYTFLEKDRMPIAPAMKCLDMTGKSSRVAIM
ncbi:TPA: hypothetical protein ACHVJ6_002902 [Bacillus cereus]